MTTAKKKKILSFDQKSKRWRKFYEGKRYYLGHGESKSDEKSYLKALEEWQKKKAEIDKSENTSKPNYEDYKQAIEDREEMVQWCILNGECEDCEQARLSAEIQWLRKQFRKPNPPNLNSISIVQKHPENQIFDCPDCNGEGCLACKNTGQRTYSNSEKVEWFERLDCLRQHGKWVKPIPDAKEKSMVNAIERYITARKQASVNGAIAVATAGTDIGRLDTFKDFCKDLSVDTFNGQSITAFKQLILSRRQEGRYAPWTTKAFLKVARECIRWLWENEFLECLPRNIKDLKFKVEQTEPEPIPIEFVKQILNGPDCRAKLYVLIALNCGTTQNEVSNIRVEEVDWELGRINRKRIKTSKFEKCPRANYKLWDKTFDLLKQYGNREGDYVLLNENGVQLVRTFFDEKGEHQKVDNIRMAYKRYCEALGMVKDIPSFKRFRKTSSNLAFNNPEFKEYYQLFLGQAPTTIGEKHYVRPDKDTLDNAIAWLGEQYNIK